MGSNTVSVIDTTINKVASIVNVGLDPLGIVVSPDGTKVYVANAGGTVSVIDTASNNVTATVPVGNCPYGIAVSPDGTKVFVTSESKVSIVDTSSYNILGTVNVGNLPIGIAVSPDGKRVYVANSDYDSKNVSIIDTSTYSIVGNVSIGNFPIGVAVSPDGEKVYVTSVSGYDNDGYVYVIDPSTNNISATVNLGDSLAGVVVNPAGTKAYVVNSGEYIDPNSIGTVSVIDTASNNVTATVPVGNYPYGIAITPDGTKLYVANHGSNNVSIIDTSTNEVIESVNVGSSPIAFGQFVQGKGIIPSPNFSEEFTQAITEITEDDNGKSINVKEFDTFYLVLSNSTYKWEINLSEGLNIVRKGSIAHDLPYMLGERGYVGGEADLWEIASWNQGTQQIKGIGTIQRPPWNTTTYIVYLTIGRDEALPTPLPELAPHRDNDDEAPPTPSPALAPHRDNDDDSPKISKIKASYSDVAHNSSNDLNADTNLSGQVLHSEAMVEPNKSRIDLNASGGQTDSEEPNSAPNILGIQSLSILLCTYLFIKYNKFKRN
jgi:YVTN family beta-propeller protein